MEVEIKLRLGDKAAHDRLGKALKPHYRQTHKQENFFFDGSKMELSRQRTVLRCRFYDVDKRALLTIKGQQVLKDGIGRGTEVEEDIDPAYARGCVQHPDKLLTLNSNLLQTVLREHAVGELICLGGFKNERSEYEWEGHKLELDSTEFPWGIVHEVEVESGQPEQLKEKLEAFLQKEGVDYKYSTTTKFANFINRTLV